MGILQKKLIIVVLLACGILAYSFHGFWQKEPDQPVAVAPALGNLSVASTTASQAADSEVVVYVSGGVNKPGVYRLPPGSRIVDAVTLAGGFALGADTTKINLAVHLKDEMQVNVPYTVSSTANGNPNPNSGASTSTYNDKININTASAAELDKLPGIGPALAERVAQYRSANGLFSNLEDLKKVPGIGEAKYNQFKDKISL
jgi:competence protein ComEA